jgi:hypothetical protein
VRLYARRARARVQAFNMRIPHRSMKIKQHKR